MRRLIVWVLCCGLALCSWSSRAANEEAEAARAQAKAHTDLGTAYFRANRFAVALEEVANALGADASYAPAYNLAGLVHMYLRERDKALENFQRALRLAPSDSEINNNYGWMLCQEGREKEAFPLFMQAVKNPLYATPTKPFYNAGMCALRIKDDALAEDFFVKAVMVDPKNMAGLYRLAEIKYRANNLHDAQRYVGVVLRSLEDDPAPLWLAIRIERKLGNRKAEADYTSQLRRKFQGSPEYQALLQGKFE